MPKKLIAERIISSAEVDLSAEDINRLLREKNRQVRFLLVSYMPLALILAYVFVSGPEGLNNGSFDADDEEAKNFELAAPYTCGGFLVLLTIFFLRYYLHTAGLIGKDLKKNKKLKLTISVDKTGMDYFNKYYITTPVRQRQHLQLNKQDFDTITKDKPLFLEIAPYSQIMLNLLTDDRIIRLH